MPFDPNICTNVHSKNNQNGKQMVRQGSADVGLLIKETIVDEANKNNLEIVGRSDKGFAYKLYRFKSCGHSQDIRMYHVRRRSFECKTCKEDLYKSEADANSLVLVGPAIRKHKTGLRRYRFKCCGHEADISIDAVRRGDFKCSECYNNRLSDDAESAGLEIIGVGEQGARYRRYRFIGCGHEQEIRLDQVFSMEFRCKSCYEIKLATDANLVGFQIISGDCANSDARKYQCLSCGEHSEFVPSSVRNKSVRCLNCLEKARIRTASNAGVEFIGKSDARKKHFRFVLPCGHEKDYQWWAVRRKQVSCSICDNTSWVNKSSVYILRISNVDGFSWLKVGHAFDVQRRISQYGLPVGARVEILSVVEFNSRSESLNAESLIMKKFKQYNIERSAMLRYHTKSGYTECFDTACTKMMLEAFTDGGQIAL